MKKKPSPGPRQAVSNPGPQNAVLKWRNVPDRDLWIYARAFHTAAKKLAGTLEPDSGLLPYYDPCPVVFMYRHAIELQLKALLLGDGGNFVATRPDHLSIRKTHSVSWLAQFVCQIVTALKWEAEFKCEGVGNLAEFQVVVEEVNSFDPGYALRCPVDPEEPGSVPGQLAFGVLAFARRMDALLELLASTADALAATWDMQTGAAAPDDELHGGSDFEPTIQ